MKLKHLLTTLILGSTTIASAQYTSQDSIMVSTIGIQTLKGNHMYEDLRYLCKQIGHRLSGTEAAAKAVAWGQKTLLAAGADSVWLQPVMVPVWKRGREELLLDLGKGWQEFEMLSLGNTIGTDGVPLKAEIISFKSMEALKNASNKDIEGKFVFLDIPFPKDVTNTFDGYSFAVAMRGQGAILTAQRGGVGVIIRAISTTDDDAPHTGTARYSDTVKKIPAIAIGNTTADALAKYLSKHNTATAQLTSECHMQDAVLSYNVVAEYKGTKHPDKYILVGGHLDTWDVGEGAHDDGSGCVQSIQVLRTYKQMNYRPNNTLRVVLFMNEENGNKGGNAYADSSKAQQWKHVFALESDAGAFTPRGIGMIVPEKERKQALSWQPLLKQFGIYELGQEGCGVDITPLKNTGVKAGELHPDNQRYFDYHHSRHDVFEAVNERELKLGAATMASFLYLVDQYWQ